jgi:TAP42-like family
VAGAVVAVRHSSIPSQPPPAIVQNHSCCCHCNKHFCRFASCCVQVDGPSWFVEEELKEVEKARSAMRAKLLEVAADMHSSGKRKQMAAQVFRPSHILPTISVEEAGVVELQQVCR